MLIFDIQRIKKSVNGDIGISYNYNKDINWGIENKALWGASDAFVDLSIKAILVGQREDAAKLLIKAKQWMECAMERQEVANHFGPASHYFHRHLYAIIRWLHEGVHDDEALSFWLREMSRYYQSQTKGVDSGSLGLAAVTFLNSGGYQEFLSLASPGGIDSIKCSGANEKQMAMTLAVQAMSQKFPEEKVHASVRKFLDSNMGKWLNGGHAIRAAEWMKVLYWDPNRNSISPFDTVRKCLDHVQISANTSS